MNRYFFLAIFLFFAQVLPAQTHPSGIIFDDQAYDQLPMQKTDGSARLAARASLRQYAPRPQDQGSYNNCVGWAVAYGARTILLAQQKGWTNPRLIQQYAFSPSFTYKLISRTRGCNEAVSIEQALSSMQNRGAALLKDVPQSCISRVSPLIYRQAQRYRISAYKRVFYRDARASEKITAVKQSLAQGQPVIAGMKCTPSFEAAEGVSLWHRKEPLHTRQFFGHAVCIVGYDNQKYGGAFQIMNSWGSKWGENGFIWIRYEDFAAFTKYGYAPEAADTNHGSSRNLGQEKAAN